MCLVKEKQEVSWKVKLNFLCICPLRAGEFQGCVALGWDSTAPSVLERNHDMEPEAWWAPAGRHLQCCGGDLLVTSNRSPGAAHPKASGKPAPPQSPWSCLLWGSLLQAQRGLGQKYTEDESQKARLAVEKHRYLIPSHKKITGR